MIPWLHGPADPLPDAEQALGAESDAPGLVAAGADLSPARLREAYGKGIFPWFSDGQPVLWWSPDPRMVLHTAEFRLRRSLAKTVRRLLADGRLEVRIDHDLRTVMQHCADAPREGQAGTWIVPEMVQAYSAWQGRGDVHSFETWIDGELAGGLYGVGLGRMFYGESMFARVTDASKIALAALVAFCRAHAIAMIDCQQRTAHLASMGAREIPRAEFLRHLRATTVAPPVARWSYDAQLWNEIGMHPAGSVSATP